MAPDSVARSADSATRLSEARATAASTAAFTAVASMLAVKVPRGSHWRRRHAAHAGSGYLQRRDLIRHKPLEAAPR